MTKAGNESADKAQDDTEILLVGYRVAVRLWTYQGTASWARYSAMLLANSIVFATVAAMLTSDVMLCAVPLLPLAGFALCIFWLAIFERGAEYQSHYVRKARELEWCFPGESVKTVQDGHDFGSGKKVTYRNGEGSKSHRMSWAARLKMRHAGRGVVAVFFLIHGLMFLASTARVLQALSDWLAVVLG